MAWNYLPSILSLRTSKRVGKMAQKVKVLVGKLEFDPWDPHDRR